MPINTDPHQFTLPIPPPPLLTRSTQPEMDDNATPSTPTTGGRFMDFITPQQTPQGSPSKNHPPPGAFDLPNAFDNALRLFPTTTNATTAVPPLSPTKQLPPSRLPQFSPAKVGLGGYDASSTAASPITAGSPTRNKENTPPTGIPRSPKKEQALSQAAQSRAGHYRTRDAAELAPARPTYVQKGLSPDDLEKIKKPAVKRMANVTQLCKLTKQGEKTENSLLTDFLDYYYDLLSYVHNRQVRSSQFQAENPMSDDKEYNDALTKYLGRERANLRKRRTRLRHGDFQILTQVGQGGYGQVYLAQKKDTREVCALKVMSKKLLFKLDEIRHVLTERDILTNANSDWLVKLLYAFQDDTSIYLAMVNSAELVLDNSNDH